MMTDIYRQYICRLLVSVSEYVWLSYDRYFRIKSHKLEKGYLVDQKDGKVMSIAYVEEASEEEIEKLDEFLIELLINESKHINNLLDQLKL